MYDGEALRYTKLYGDSNAKVVGVPMAATQAVKAKSGRFVFMNAGAATLCKSDSQTIFGWLRCRAKTPATGEVVPCEVDPTAIYRIPVLSGTYAVGMIGDVCDLAISAGGIQGAALDASTHDLIKIVGGDANHNKWVDVMINVEEHGTGLGTDA